MGFGFGDPFIGQLGIVANTSSQNVFNPYYLGLPGQYLNGNSSVGHLTVQTSFAEDGRSSSSFSRFVNNLGSYIPGTQLAENSAQYFARIATNPNSSTAAKIGATIGGAFASLWTPDTAIKTAFTIGAGGLAGQLTKGIGKKIAQEVDEFVTVFRGVRSNHPGFKNATKGIAKPRSPLLGHTNSFRHNVLGDTKSKFVSVTTNRNVAQRFSGRNGVVLETRIPSSRLTKSPDVFNESELLVKGGFKGAKVIKP